VVERAAALHCHGACSTDSGDEAQLENVYITIGEFFGERTSLARITTRNDNGNARVYQEITMSRFCVALVSTDMVSVLQAGLAQNIRGSCGSTGWRME
jgi:hypothetical protein